MTVTVLAGDCVARLAESTELFDACVCDPPYELGFMGKGWDRTGVAFRVETWRAIFDRLRPGAHLVAFGGTRTFHRMAVAIEDAGFEIRDMLAWTYGSGFPKSLDVSKAIDKAAGAEREVVGRKADPRYSYEFSGNASAPMGNVDPRRERSDHGNLTAPATDVARKWQGWGTALKPALEPICLARKPLIGTVAANVLAHGTGGLNIDACRVEAAADYHDLDVTQGGNRNLKFGMAERQFAPASGRFPANLLHDGSDEVLAGFPEAGGGCGATGKREDSGWRMGVTQGPSYPNEGSAARFFYSAKAGPLDRIGSAHATVKPVDLMRWLVRLVTPPGGHLLDPFAGSGTTGIAALAEGFDATLIELEPDHVADIERKLAYLRGEGASRVVEHLKRKAVEPDDDHGPLFR